MSCSKEKTILSIKDYKKPRRLNLKFSQLSIMTIQQSEIYVNQISTNTDSTQKINRQRCVLLGA
jgi:hypothetical protein